MSPSGRMSAETASRAGAWRPVDCAPGGPRMSTAGAGETRSSAVAARATFAVSSRGVRGSYGHVGDRRLWGNVVGFWGKLGNGRSGGFGLGFWAGEAGEAQRAK